MEKKMLYTKKWNFAATTAFLNLGLKNLFFQNINLKELILLNLNLIFLEVPRILMK